MSQNLDVAISKVVADLQRRAAVSRDIVERIALESVAEALGKLKVVADAGLLGLGRDLDPNDVDFLRERLCRFSVEATENIRRKKEWLDKGAPQAARPTSGA